MKELFIQTLESLGFSIFLQGSLGKDEAYPESFFTFFTNNTDGESFYDNDENAIVWDFDLNFYSSDPTLVNTILLEAKKLLKRRGFVVTGAGYDVMADEPSHTGRGINVLIKERLLTNNKGGNENGT